MRKHRVSALIALMLCLPLTMQAKVEHLLPKVHSLTETKGTPFALQRTVTITDVNNTAALEKVFTDYGCTVGAGGATVTVEMVESIEGAYDYTLEGYDNEGYQLTVTENAITIKAVKPIGVIRAAQTLAQLAEGYEDGQAAIETVEITDWAAFKLRGYMHDVGRSFISVDELKKHIDLLSRFKVNTFHWHFTENQAWRFEVKDNDPDTEPDYTKLTSAESMTRFAGNFYTQEQCREVAAYAKERGVTIIPEIDMPGHSDAFDRAMGFGMQTDEGVAVLKEVLTQVADVFPDAPYIHIGADEEAITYDNFLGIMADKIHSLGKKMVVWNPIRGVSINSTMCDMTQMWSSSGNNINGVPDIDCRYNYTNHFDVFADVVGIYKSNIYYKAQGDAEIAGTISAYWNDRKMPDEEDIVKQNNMYANVLASAERAWTGSTRDGAEGYIEKMGTTLPNSGEVYDEFCDWERRFLFHKANSLKDEPIPYVKQTNVRWRITEPFPNGGNAAATSELDAYATSTDDEGLIPETFTHDGKTYYTGMATGAGIYLRHTWGNNTIPTYYGSTNYSNHTAYAWTYVYSDKEQTVGAQIEFQNYGRSEHDQAPDDGKWDRKGSDIWLNGTRINPPTWDNAGFDPSNEEDLLNENFSARKPIEVTLKQGWNKVFIKLPYVSASNVRLNKWMFTFVLTDLEGKNAVEGLIYSPNQCMDEATELVAAKISEIKRDRGNLIGTAIGLWPESAATALDTKVAEIEATYTATMTAGERAAQVTELAEAWTAFAASLTSDNMNLPIATTSTDTTYYRMYTPLRGNRYPTSKGAGADIVGEDTPTDNAIWMFVKRTGNTFDIVNAVDASYISPASNNNTALRTVAEAPATGWTITPAATTGYVIITNGTAQFNQTNNNQLGFKVYNWGYNSDSKTFNTTDTGCQYVFEEVEYTPNDIAGTTVEYVINTSTGTFSGSGNYRSSWTYTVTDATPATLTLSCAANNMNSHDSFIQLHSGSVGESTYTLTVPAGYAIVSYSFNYAFGNSGTGDKKFIIGGQEYPVTADAQTVNIEGINASSTTFTLSGANQPVKMSNFVVKVAAAGGDSPLPQVGKYYRIKGISGNYIDAVNCYSGDQMGMKSASECDFRGTIFYLDEGNRLLNVATNTYVYGTRHIGAAKADASTWTFAISERNGDCITLTANGSTSHQLHDNAGNRADRCSSICGERHDFIMEEVSSLFLMVDGPSRVGATATWNGETKPLPAIWAFFEGEPTDITAPTLSITCNAGYTFDGLYEDGAVLGTTIDITSVDKSRTITARFSPAFFSASTAEEGLTPVRIRNIRDNSYTLRLNASDNYNGHTVNSGITAYGENEIWYLVGNSSSFRIYNHITGTNLNLSLAGTSSGSAASMNSGTDNADFCLVETDNGYAICPTANKEQSFNMHGGAGYDIKLYSKTDAGSIWAIERMDLSKSLTFSVSIEGETWEENRGVGAITITVDGISGKTAIESFEGEQKCYLPLNGTFSITSDTYRGYTFNGFDVNGTTVNSLTDRTLSESLKVTASYIANEEKVLYYTPSPTGKPYRIPAIATAPNGHIFAIADHRPCGNDIGYGEVDIMCRISTDNGATWGKEFFVADGQGGETNEMTTGFGDAAIVADCDQNKLLVMMVCGRTVCHNGRWDKSKIGDKTADAVNRVARVYATYNETTKTWEWTQPEEVTDHIYSLFLNGETPTVTSMFIGSGKICQSRVVKKGEYYRLYCSMWTRDGGNRVIYSDDFGGTWNVLGTIADRPASGGDEPKCEELPDGTVVLSSRKGGGRYFNLFTFNDDTYTTGTWGTVVSSNNVENGLSFGGNSTNGEIYKVSAIRKSDGAKCDVMFQSIPTGSGRSDVAVFYKELDADTYTTTTIAQGWTKGIHVSTKSSCYSTMILQADGRIAFLFEEEPGGYSIVYIPYTIEDLTGGNYSLYNEENGGGSGIAATTRNDKPGIYNLMGQKVTTMTRGIYILNGQKVIKQ